LILAAIAEEMPMQFFALIEDNVEQPACDWSRDRAKRFGNDKAAFDIFDREGQCVDQRIGGNVPVVRSQMLGVDQHLDGWSFVFTVDQDFRGELAFRTRQALASAVVMGRKRTTPASVCLR
jgi:hypothetical protein